MLNEKQELLFKELKGIKDLSVLDTESFLELPKNSPLVEEYELLHRKFNSEEKKAFSKEQNEVVETVIYRVLEMIDGYGSLPYSVDLIDKEKNESLRMSGELHDGFMSYLYVNEEPEK
ncbi:histidine kinase [Planococcus shixiaomingii]|uniref:histidine kinase n=1 Tax=Planococcus shixiaomingii TaxID=3058393 RepID=UPI00262CD489|nr:histidine kinase [Planococcus sp. N022]WKA53228.1 histidine kinase [Planococcus sp. N022]